MTKNNYHVDKIFCHNKKNFSLKDTFEVILQYIFNVFIVFNIVFKLKVDPKMRTFKNLEKIKKKRVATLNLKVLSYLISNFTKQ